jgi:hypothetical protein
LTLTAEKYGEGGAFGTGGWTGMTPCTKPQIVEDDEGVTVQEDVPPAPVNWRKRLGRLPAAFRRTVA